MFKLLPLLNKRIDDLTEEDFAMVADVMKIEVNLTTELKDAGLALLKGDSIDKVSDLISSPESVKKLLEFFQPVKVAVIDGHTVMRCPHCGGFTF